MMQSNRIFAIGMGCCLAVIGTGCEIAGSNASGPQTAAPAPERPAVSGSARERIVPALIERIQDGNGATLYRGDERDCAACRVDSWRRQAAPQVYDSRERVLPADSAARF